MPAVTIVRHPTVVHRCGGELLAGSASGWASHGDPAALATLEADPHRWRQFLDQETRACAEPGIRGGGGGTHRLFADHTHRRITGGSPPTRCVRPENHELVELRCPGLLGEQQRLRLDPLGVLVARGHPNKIRAFMWVALFDAHRASDQGVRPATGSL